ncbi:angiopoietin-4-like, partial [Musca vetustissima]|uniref:angiopoietin-4-like n=1 Tax=Musca vetustissima TaxID=27455 RepID=UPI002AB6FF5C
KPLDFTNWTTIARRKDGSVNFYRNWRSYKMGFGNPPHGEYFIGLERLHELTTAVPNIELKVILRDWQGEDRYALYDGFQIGNEAEKYRLKVLGKYSGTAGDSLAYHKGMKFTTFDEDNDNNDVIVLQIIVGNKADDNVVASTVSTIVEEDTTTISGDMITLLKNDTTTVSNDDTAIPENTTIISDEDTTTTEEYYNPYEDEQQLFLWSDLFLKVNEVLVVSKNMNSETKEMHTEMKEMHNETKEMRSEMTRMYSEINKLNTNLLDVTQKIDDLTKRQGELEGNMAKIVEQQMSSMNVTLMERQEELQGNMTKIAQQISSMNVNLMERLRQQEFDMRQILQDVSKISPTENEEVNWRENLWTLRYWTTIASRKDGSVDFNRNWRAYKVGFGKPPHDDFFIGLDRLHELTTTVPNIQLKVILRDWDDEERYALYDGFQIGNEAEKYRLKVLGKYSGTAGDSLSSHKGMKFTTFDEDNDNSGGNCAKQMEGVIYLENIDMKLKHKA